MEKKWPELNYSQRVSSKYFDASLYNLFYFSHLLVVEKIKNRVNLCLFTLDPKPRKFEIKRINDKISRFVACQIM